MFRSIQEMLSKLSKDIFLFICVREEIYFYGCKFLRLYENVSGICVWNLVQQDKRGFLIGGSHNIMKHSWNFKYNGDFSKLSASFCKMSLTIMFEDNIYPINTWKIV